MLIVKLKANRSCIWPLLLITYQFIILDEIAFLRGISTIFVTCSPILPKLIVTLTYNDPIRINHIIGLYVMIEALQLQKLNSRQPNRWQSNCMTKVEWD